MEREDIIKKAIFNLSSAMKYYSSKTENQLKSEEMKKASKKIKELAIKARKQSI